MQELINKIENYLKAEERLGYMPFDFEVEKAYDELVGVLERIKKEVV